MKEVDYFGPTAKLHHVGLAIPSIEKSNLTELEVFSDPIQQVNVSFIKLGDINIELIEPDSEHSPITNSLNKGNKLVHLCYEVDSLEQSIKSAIDNQFKVLQEPVHAVAFNHRRIAWVYHRFWGLFELLERDHTDGDHSL
ncbi:VOC family protein [Paenibacillus sp. EC2-1]|uniref:VOC family protein n=1 Tax=Paenibacillus sp. EC2-1 TaxID=3388665 RepID=UPI003BEEE2BF